MTSSIFDIDFENVDSVPSECNIPIKKNEYDQSAERPCCSFDESYEILPAESNLMKISKDMSVYRYNSDEAKAERDMRILRGDITHDTDMCSLKRRKYSDHFDLLEQFESEVLEVEQEADFLISAISDSIQLFQSVIGNENS